MHTGQTTALLSGSPGWAELVLVFAVVLVLFGPRRLPDIARMIGKALGDLRRASQDFHDEIMRIEDDPRPDVHTHADAPPPGDQQPDEGDESDEATEPDEAETATDQQPTAPSTPCTRSGQANKEHPTTK